MSPAHPLREFLRHSLLARFGFAIALLLLLVALLAQVILALIITGWAGYARLARAQVLKVKELEFVLAAKSLGASHTRILARHLLPNIMQPVLIQATIGMAGAILAEATLSFLGLGVLRVGVPCSTTRAIIFSMRRTWWSSRRWR
jgi:peptide/nickel transport system permease protein